MNRKLFLVFLFCITVAKSNSQNASFFKEDLTFRIEGDRFFVNGIYSLRNKYISDNKIVLNYPFPTDTIYTYPDSLYIYNLNTGQEINNYIKKDDGVIFDVEIDSITDLFISYQQQLKSNVARYILTTTKQWGAPFEIATYKLIYNDTLQIKSFSNKPDKQERFEDGIVYYWTKENFMPSKDMIFTLY